MAEPTDALLRYDVDEASGTTLKNKGSAGSDWDLTISGAAWVAGPGATGVLVDALDFDGTDDSAETGTVSLGDLLSGGFEYTLAVLCTVEDVGPSTFSEECIAIASDGGSSDNGFYLQPWSDGEVYGGFGTGGNFEGEITFEAVTNSLRDTTFRWWIVTCEDIGSGNVQVSGYTRELGASEILEDQGNRSANLDNIDIDEFALGNNAAGNQFFTGKVAAVRVFDRPLSSAERDELGNIDRKTATVQASTSTGTVSGTSIEIDTPTGATTDDVLVAIVELGDNVDPANVTAPSGDWDRVGNTIETTSHPRAAVFAMPLTAAPASSYTFTKPSGNAVGIMLRVQDADLDHIVDVGISSDTTDDSNPQTAPSVTTETDNALRISFYGANPFNDSGTEYDAAEAGEDGSEIATGTTFTTAMASWDTIATAGATGTRTADFPAVEYTAVMGAFAIRSDEDDGTSTEVEKTFSLDSILKGEIERQFTLDASLKAELERAFSLDAVALAEFERTFSLDALLKGEISKEFFLDAILKAELEKQFSLDASLVGTIELQFALDAIVGELGKLIYHLDAVLIKPKSFTLDAILKARPDVDFILGRLRR